jgi:hypothetical protein
LSFLTFRYICEYISHIFNFRQLVWQNWFPWICWCGSTDIPLLRNLELSPQSRHHSNIFTCSSPFFTLMSQPRRTRHELTIPPACGQCRIHNYSHAARTSLLGLRVMISLCPSAITIAYGRWNRSVRITFYDIQFTWAMDQN